MPVSVLQAGKRFLVNLLLTFARRVGHMLFSFFFVKQGCQNQRTAGPKDFDGFVYSLVALPPRFLQIFCHHLCVSVWRSRPPLTAFNYINSKPWHSNSADYIRVGHIFSVSRSSRLRGYSTAVSQLGTETSPGKRLRIQFYPVPGNKIWFTEIIFGTNPTKTIFLRWSRYGANIPSPCMQLGSHCMI